MRGERRPFAHSLVESASQLPPVSRLIRPRRRPTRDSAVVLFVEVVHFYLYDLGRSVDIPKVKALIPANPDMGVAKKRDTPASLSLPRALVVQLGDGECQDLGGFECLSSQAKIYEDGAVTIVVRVKARVPLNELHLIARRKIRSGGAELSIREYAEHAYVRVRGAIHDAIVEPFEIDASERESYVAYCLLDATGPPSAFLDRNRDYLAALLVGEESEARLDEGQIEATLGKPFSYHESDLAVFDLDRCLIIDPSADYEDLLLIMEHANYQLMELRVLDKLLDKWLDEAEDDVRAIYGPGRREPSRALLRRRRLPRERGSRGPAAKIKLAKIQALRFDALFILENLENSSKIIGDYYLGQVYDRLCSIFNTEGWKWSVERRLDALQDVYDMVKTDAGERRMIALEVTFIIVCIVFPIIQIVQAIGLANH
ncbi:MAG: hypothetical protein Q8M76_05130 [Spirochaetaceae bacterium]|nr:hypothetical protein [Spirochaetaceae bacterium]